MVLENKTNEGHVLWMNIHIFSSFSDSAKKIIKAIGKTVRTYIVI